MPRLVNNVSGAAADTDPVNNLAPIIYNVDPLDVEKSLLYTVYAWATAFGGAQISLFVSPQEQGSPIQPVWFPLLDSTGAPIVLSSMKYVSFSLRFGAIKGEISGASSATSGLCCTLFNPGLSFPNSTP